MNMSNKQKSSKNPDLYLFQTNKGVKVACLIDDSDFSLKPCQGVIEENWKELLKVQVDPKDIVSVCEKIKPDILLLLLTSESVLEKFESYVWICDAEYGIANFGGNKCLIWKGLGINAFSTFYKLFQLIDQCKSIKSTLDIE